MHKYRVKVISLYLIRITLRDIGSKTGRVKRDFRVSFEFGGYFVLNGFQVGYPPEKVQFVAE